MRIPGRAQGKCFSDNYIYNAKTGKHNAMGIVNQKALKNEI